MLGQPGKGEVSVICDTAFLPEFPDLLCGVNATNNVSYIDATVYLNKAGQNKTIQQFVSQYRPQINALCDAYAVKHENVVVINSDGHYLIDSNFVYLLISFVEPNFLAHMCDRIHELFSYGLVVSDSYLLQKARERLPSEVLMQIAGDETNPNQ